MSQIAAMAGGSKGTLYNYFASKEDLFVACVRRHCETLRAQFAADIRDGANIKDVLGRIGRHYVDLAFSPSFVRRFRVIVAEADRVPEIGDLFYENGPKRATQAIADYLEEKRQAGCLDFFDSLTAAQSFVALCSAPFAMGRYSNALAEINEQQLQAQILEAVRVFIAAYGTTPA